MSGVTLEIPALGLSLVVADLFLGTGGVTCQVEVGQAVSAGSISFDGTTFSNCTIPPVSLFGDASGGGGFAAAFSQASITIIQNSLSQFTVLGNVAIPFLDDTVLMGISAGLDASGAITVAATSTLNSCGVGSTAPSSVIPPTSPTLSSNHLFELANVLDGTLTIDVDSIAFIVQPGQPAAIDIACSIAINIPVLSQAGSTPPSFGVQGLRIDTSGNIAIDGGWVSLPSTVPSQIAGIFPFSITKFGLGTDSRGSWVGLNGGIKLADGLPLGLSVSGLRVYYAESPVGIALDGIGLTVTVPGAFSFTGSAAYFQDTTPGATDSGFRGSLKLTIIPLQIELDASLVVGQQNGVLYVFLSVGVDLPSGIPIPLTGLAFFGFSGLLAVNMAPNRQPGEDWYTGWYLGSPAGVTDGSKWAPVDGSFAIGLGATLGTQPDLGFTGSVKAIVVVVIPGPQLIFSGMGNVLQPRPGLTPASATGTFNALIVYDNVNDLFQADLSATYNIAKLLSIGGGAELAGCWAPGYDPTVYWHFYLGQNQPTSKMLHATLLNIFNADAYLMINRDNFQVGANITLSKKFSFSVASAWLTAQISGTGDVSFNPQHYVGQLSLTGNAGLSAFGASISAALNSSFQAQGPTPWQVAIDVYLDIKVNLVVTNAEFSVNLPLTWQDDPPATPSPVSPVVASGDGTSGGGVVVAHPNPPVTDIIALSSSPSASVPMVPPDGVPTVSFARPVGDAIQIGGGAAVPCPDVVGEVTFSYSLVGAILISGNQLVSATAQGSVAGTTLTPAGSLGLPQTSSCVVTIAGVSQVGSIGSTGAITLSSPPGDGSCIFSVAPVLQSEAVTINAVGASQGTTSLTLAAAPQAGFGVYAGGLLTIGDTSWSVVGGSGTTLTIQSPGGAPSVGAATLSAPPPPALQGQWLAATPPSDPSANCPALTTASMTSLQLWASCPFSTFAYNTAGAAPTDSSYGCGPAPTEGPACLNFQHLPLGFDNDSFVIGGVTFSDQAMQIEAVNANGARAACIGRISSAGGGARGFLRAQFGGVEDEVTVTLLVAPGAIASLTGYLDDKAAGPIHKIVPPRGSSNEHQRIQLRAVDAFKIAGFGVYVESVCVVPAWSCVTFSSTFPQESTGTVAYEDLSFESSGVLTVVNSVLNVGSVTVDSSSVDTKEVGPLLRRPGGVRLSKVTIVLPQPCTRVSITLTAGAVMTVYAGKTSIDQQTASSGTTLAFKAGANQGAANPGWFDRVVLTSLSHPLQIQEICYVGGAYGLACYRQWQWQASVQQAVTPLYEVQPVLPPGTYSLGFVTETQATGSAPSYETAWSNFQVGPPPNQSVDLSTDPAVNPHYPSGGAILDLATYVATTVPVASGAPAVALPSPAPVVQTPFFRRLDTNVTFATGYVNTMYLEAQSPLELLVVDVNGNTQRSSASNSWGNAATPNLAPYETGFILGLQSDGSSPCVNVALSKLATPQVLASSGSILPPSALLRNELQATGSPLFRSPFRTSKYGNLRHVLATNDGTCTPVGGVSSLIATASTGAATVDQLIENANAAATAYQSAVSDDDLASLMAATTDLAAALADVASGQAATFGTIQAALPSPLSAQLPEGIALTRFDGTGSTITMFLVESDEPLPWSRITVNVVATVSANRRTVMPIEPSFGSPDQNQVVDLPAATVTSNVELLLVQTSQVRYVTSRVAGAATSISIGTDQASVLSATVIVNQRGQVALQSSPPASGDPPPQGPTTSASGDPTANPATLTLTGTVTSTAVLTGTSFGVEALDVTAAYQPVPPNGFVRINAVKLPSSGGDTGYSIDLTFLDSGDVSGWTVTWWDLQDPAAEATVMGVLPSGSSFTEAAEVRWYPGLTSPPSDTDVDQVLAGGADTPPPPQGALLQLVNTATGAVAHEWIATPLGLEEPFTVIPNADGTRAFLVGPAVPSGTVTLEFTMNLASPGLPTWSIAGQSNAETAYVIATD